MVDRVSRKIELIQDGKNWHWVIIEWSDNGGWHNVGSGYETSYEQASREAKRQYDLMK